MGESTARRHRLEARARELDEYFTAYRQAGIQLLATSPLPPDAASHPAVVFGRIEVVVCSNAAWVLIYSPSGATDSVVVEQFQGTTDDFTRRDPRAGLYSPTGARLEGSGVGIRAGAGNFLEIMPEPTPGPNGEVFATRWARAAFISHDVALPDPIERAKGAHSDLLETLAARPSGDGSPPN